MYSLRGRPQTGQADNESATVNSVFSLPVKNCSIFSFLSQVLNPKKKGKKKKKYQNSGTVWRGLAVFHGANMSDSVDSVQTLVGRSPSCLAWWTQNCPSWTTYEGGKCSSTSVWLLTHTVCVHVYLLALILRQITSCLIICRCLLWIMLRYNLTWLMAPPSSSHDLFLLVGLRLISQWRSISQHRMVSVLKPRAYQRLSERVRLINLCQPTLACVFDVRWMSLSLMTRAEQSSWKLVERLEL